MKGLEPELHNMMEQHQREIQELRFAHIKELQDTELRAMRRSNQQLEQLRIELTDTHEKMLAKEKDILTARWTTMSRIIVNTLCLNILFRLYMKHYITLPQIQREIGRARSTLPNATKYPRGTFREREIDAYCGAEKTR